MSKTKSLEMTKKLGFQIVEDCQHESDKILSMTMHLVASLLATKICLCLKKPAWVKAIDDFHEKVKKMLEETDEAMVRKNE